MYAVWIAMAGSCRKLKVIYFSFISFDNRFQQEIKRAMKGQGSTTEGPLASRHPASGVRTGRLNTPTLTLSPLTSTLTWSTGPTIAAIRAAMVAGRGVILHRQQRDGNTALFLNVTKVGSL